MTNNSLLHPFDKNLPHPPQKHPKIPALIQPIHTTLYRSLLNFRPTVCDPVLPPLRIKLEPRLPLPIPLIQTAKHKFEPIHLPRSLNPQPQIRLPKLQFGPIKSGLRLHLLRMRLLRGPSGGDLPAVGTDVRLEAVAVLGVGVALLRYGQDGGLHLGRFGFLGGEGGGVVGGFLRESLDGALLGALVLCVHTIPR